MKREQIQYKEWNVIYKGDVMLGIVFGDKEAKAALIKYPGARRRGYRTYKAALRAFENGLDFDNDNQQRLF